METIPIPRENRLFVPVVEDRGLTSPPRRIRVQDWAALEEKRVLGIAKSTNQRRKSYG